MPLIGSVAMPLGPVRTNPEPDDQVPTMELMLIAAEAVLASAASERVTVERSFILEYRRAKELDGGVGGAGGLRVGRAGRR